MVRASEASHPGPPNSSGELASRLAQQRARAMEALNGCGLAAGNATPLARQADVETVSARSVLSPLSRLHPGLPEQCGEHSAFPHRPGDTAPTMMEPATPGYTPVDLPAPLSWQTMGPPVADPGPSGHSWLYVPLLHAAAGQLDATAAADWRAHPHVGPQWHALVCALGEAPPVAPAALIRQIERLAHADGLMHAGSGIPQLASSIRACAAASLSIWNAMLLCMDGTGYIPATAQNALLELYGGARAACAAHDLATAICESWAVPLAPPAPSRSRRRGRGRGGGRGRRRRSGPHSTAAEPSEPEGATATHAAATSPALSADTRPLVGRRSTKWICRLSYGAQCRPSKMCRRSCVMPCMLRWCWRSGPSSATASHAAVVWRHCGHGSYSCSPRGCFWPDATSKAASDGPSYLSESRRSSEAIGSACSRVPGTARSMGRDGIATRTLACCGVTSPPARWCAERRCRARGMS